MNSPLENYPHHKQFAEMYKGSNLVSNYRTLYADWVLDEFQALLQRQQSDEGLIEALQWVSDNAAKMRMDNSKSASGSSGFHYVHLETIRTYLNNTRLKEGRNECN